jgi:hypothetical protein
VPSLSFARRLVCARANQQGYDPDVTDQPDTPDSTTLHRVQEVLRTWRRVTFLPGDEKLMHYILKGFGADLEVTARAFVVRYDWHPSRHRYFANTAPGIVSKLLEWCEARVASWFDVLNYV